MARPPNPFRRQVIRNLTCGACGRITIIENLIPHYYPIECLGCHRVWIGSPLFTVSRPMTEDRIYIDAGLLRLQTYLKGKDGNR